jgi:hypothetical protein
VVVLTDKPQKPLPNRTPKPETVEKLQKAGVSV